MDVSFLIKGPKLKGKVYVILHGGGNSQGHASPKSFYRTLNFYFAFNNSLLYLCLTLDFLYSTRIPFSFFLTDSIKCQICSY